MSHAMASTAALHPAPAAFAGPARAGAASLRLPLASSSCAPPPAARHLRASWTPPPAPLRARSMSSSTTRRRCAAAADDDNDTDTGFCGPEIDAQCARLWPWGEHFPEQSEWDSEGILGAHERFSRESAEAGAALKEELAGVVRPLLDCFHHFCSLKTRFDTEDYHIGMPFGALTACVGCYQLWRMNPSVFLDVALAYTFYRLSIVSLHLRKRGFSNDLITRIKFVIVVIMAISNLRNNLCMFVGIRAFVYFLYTYTFVSDVAGLKKCTKYYIAAFYVMLRIKEGRRELAKIMSKALDNFDNNL